MWYISSAILFSSLLLGSAHGKVSAAVASATANAPAPEQSSWPEPTYLTLLNEENFDTLVGKGKPAMITFTKDDCEPCADSEYHLREAYHLYGKNKSKLVVGKLDVVRDGKSIAERLGITEYPTVKYFDDKGVPITYEGKTDISSFVNYLTRKTGITALDLVEQPTHNVVDVTLRSFDEVALDRKKNVIVFFVVPWCAQCFMANPNIERVSNYFQQDEDCVIARFTMDEEQHADFREKHRVYAYPTLRHYSKGSNKEADYNIDATDATSEANLVDWINKKCKTKRVVGGMLNNEAGLIPELDALSYKLFTAKDSDRAEILEETQTVAEKHGDKAKHYLHAMKKIVDGNTDYIEKEGKRLQTVLKNKKLDLAKLDDLKIKSNILKSFFRERKAKKGKGKGKKKAKKAEAKHDEL